MQAHRWTRATLHAARLLSPALAAILVANLVTVAVAAAAESEFKPAGATLTGTSGTVKLSADNGTNTISCRKSESTGQITSALLAGSIIARFSGCFESGTKGSNCTLKSIGAAEGLVVTTTLHGILGTVLPSGAVGLLVLPVSGKRFTTLAGTACAVETTVTGSIAGLVSPTGKSTASGKVTFGVSSGKQEVAKIDLTHGLGFAEPELDSFSTSATLELAMEQKYGPATEVS